MSASPLEVITRNGADRQVHRTSFNGVVPLVLVRQNQAVPITLQFPADKAGMPVAAEPIDGGSIEGGNLTVLPTGMVNLVFKPGGMPGRYRLIVRTPPEQHLLEFYLVDPNDPGGNKRTRRN